MHPFLLTLAAASAALSLAACGEGAVREENAPEAAADAAAVDQSVPAADDPTAPVGATAQNPDERGTTGTAAPDGAGKPGVTLPTTPPAEADASANPAAPD